MVAFSIIMPTYGREGLYAAVINALAQMGTNDELLVIHDGPFENYPLPVCVGENVKLYITPLTRYWGNFQRDVGLTLARGTHIIFADDDDKLCLTGVRGAIREEPTIPHLFNMVGAGVSKNWLDRPLSRVKGSTCLVVPNNKHKLHLWGTEFSHSYVQRTLAEYGNNCVIHPDITICEMRVFSPSP